LAGVAPSAKHFPGHGDTHVDSHLGLPRILKSKEQLLATELVPFRLLIENRIATVMTGHMALPNIIGDDTPCSLSKLITTGFLRNEMKYAGVVVTDCLEMDAIKEIYGIEKGSLLAFQAGADIAMICHTLDKQQEAIRLVSDAVEKGELSVEALQASGHRIRVLKSKFAGSWADVLEQPLDVSKVSQLKSTNAELSLRAYSLSTSLVGDSSSILPLKAVDNIVVLTPENESLNKAVDDAEGVLRNGDGKLRNTAGPSNNALARAIARRSPASRHVVYTKDLAIPVELDEILQSSNSIVFATRNADRSTWQLEHLLKVVRKAPTASVVVVATCNPYDLINSGIDINFPYAYIATFEFTPPALEAAAAVIFGEKVATGKVPVLGGMVYK
jgi:beta-N-acetylhexosaminidase